MDKQDINKLIEKQQKISDRNFYNYQESGERRYLRAHERAEDLIDLAQRALKAADEHQELGSMRSYISGWSTRAISILHAGNNDEKQDEINELLKEIRSIGLMYGLTRDPWS